MAQKMLRFGDGRPCWSVLPRRVRVVVARLMMVSSLVIPLASGLGVSSAHASTAHPPKASTHFVLHLAPVQVQIGHQALVSGKVSPASKASIVLQVFASGHWRSVTHRKATAAGLFTFAVNAALAGRYAIRVGRAATSTTKAGVSVTVHLTVTAPLAPPALPPGMVGGLLQWPDGKAAANAEILFYPQGVPDAYSVYQAPTVTIYTDSTGHYLLPGCSCPILDAEFYLVNSNISYSPQGETSTGTCAIPMHVTGVDNWNPVGAEPGQVINYTITPMECLPAGIPRENIPGLIAHPLGAASNWKDAEALSG